MRPAAFIPLLLIAAFADPRCNDCHRKEAAAFARSGMGRSFRFVPRDLPGGEFRHSASGSAVEISGVRHRIRRGRQALEGDVLYAVGSGTVGMSFLVRTGEWLYQSPAAYFSARRAWGPSPGYEEDASLNFSRPITAECIFCHAGSTEWVEGSINRFGEPAGSLQGFPCQRCHGAGGDHLRQPSAANIINPARLEGAVRDSVCEQCHLAGVARVLNAGKRWWDFLPGARLEDNWSVYVWQQRDSDADLQVVSHAEQLAASACGRVSRGKLWCGSCHRVHGGNMDISTACRSCHASAHSDIAARQGSCGDCHMSKRPAADGGHTAFTDHRIRRIPRGPSAPGQIHHDTLRAWRPGTSIRNEGLAYIQAGDRLQSAELMQHGFRLLAERQKEFEADADVLAALGYVLLRKNRPAEAVTLLGTAVRLAPRNVGFRLNLGLALAAGGKSARARAALEELLSLDASVEAARAALKQLPNR